MSSRTTILLYYPSTLIIGSHLFYIINTISYNLIPSNPSIISLIHHTFCISIIHVYSPSSLLLSSLLLLPLIYCPRGSSYSVTLTDYNTLLITSIFLGGLLSYNLISFSQLASSSIRSPRTVCSISSYYRRYNILSLSFIITSVSVLSLLIIIPYC